MMDWWWIMYAPLPVRTMYLFLLLSVRFFISNHDCPPFSSRSFIDHVPCATSLNDSALLSSADPVCVGLPSTANNACRPIRYSYTRDQLIASKQSHSRLDHDLIGRLKELSIGYRLPRRRSCRGGIRKQRRIPVVVGHRSSEDHRRSTCDSDFPTTPTSINGLPRSSSITGANPTNLIVIPLQNSNLRKQLCICQFNAKSVGTARKRSAITDFMRDHDVDIMFLTESWLRESGDEAKCADLTPPGYKFFSFPRQVGPTAKCGGGIAAIVKDCLATHSSITSSFTFTHTSFQAVDLSLALNKQRLHLLCVYRPPPSKKNKLTDGIFFDEFPDFLDYCNALDGSLLLTGDFNVHYEDLRDPRTRKFRELLETFDLSQAINEPTFLRSGHTLDLVISRDSDCLLLSAECCHDLTSDHVCTLCHLNAQKQKPAPSFKSVRSINNIDKTDFAHDLSCFVTRDISLSDLNIGLVRALDKHAPVRQREIRHRRATPWYDSVAPELQQLKRERRRAERRWASSRLTVDKQIYDAAKQTVIDFVNNAKTTFYSSKIAAATSCKELFRTVHSMMGKAMSAVLPSSYEMCKLPQLFQDFFVQKIVSIRDGFPALSAGAPDHSTPYVGTPLVEFSPMSEQFVRELITKSTKTSCDLDPIPTALLCDHIDLLLPSITRILNDSLATGIVPTDLKTALVKPLLKKSSLDPEVLQNYRPISNLPFLSKILEKAVLHQLSSHLAANHLLTPHQSAYRTGHSTETAILSILDNILTSLDDNKISALLLLDLSAAFDTIDHEILLHRLQHTFGIQGTSLNWFQSYLSERKQFVSANDHRSLETSLLFGVPQGSVLGPVLFIMYTTPLSDVIGEHSVSHEMFADDTQLLNSSPPDDCSELLSTLQSCTADVDTWMSTNKLKLNCDKTEAILFSKQHHPTCLPTSITLGHSTIDFSDTVRDLGVYLDSDLSMKQQITKLCQAAYIELKRISSIRPFLTEEATKTLVSSYVLSRLDYCNSVLLGCPQSVIQPLQRVQNSAARIIFRSPRNQPCTPLLKTLHWLPVECRIKFKCCCLCFKILTGSAPSYLSDLVHIYVPSRTLRSSADTRIFRLPTYNRKQHGQRAFSYSAVKTFNDLPYSVRHCQTLTTFKTNLKTHLFKEYFQC